MYFYYCYSHVVVLCGLCGSHQFYSALAEEMGGRSPAYAVDECRKLLSRHASSSTCWAEIVDIILLITKYVSEEQALNTLIKLTQVIRYNN